MEAVMLECLTWQLGIFNNFHLVRTTLSIIPGQFGLHILYAFGSAFNH